MSLKHLSTGDFINPYLIYLKRSSVFAPFVWLKVKIMRAPPSEHAPHCLLWYFEGCRDLRHGKVGESVPAKASVTTSFSPAEGEVAAVSAGPAALALRFCASLFFFCCSKVGSLNDVIA